MRMRSAVAVVVALSASLLAPLAADAKAIQNDVVVYPGSDTTQWMDPAEYHHLMTELGLLMSAKVMNPSNTLGVNGFDMGIEADTALIHGQNTYWTKASKDGSVPRIFSYPTLRVRKGLPFSFEGGMTIGYLPFTQQQVLGGDGRFAIHEGYALVPNLALQLSYNKYIGNQQLDMEVRQAAMSLGYTWPFGESAALKTGKVSVWVGYSKGDIDSNIGSNVGFASPAEKAAFFTAIGTDQGGHLLVRYDKWITGVEIESGHFSFTVNGEFVDAGIPTINARWGTQF